MFIVHCVCDYALKTDFPSLFENGKKYNFSSILLMFEMFQPKMVHMMPKNVSIKKNMFIFHWVCNYVLKTDFPGVSDNGKQYFFSDILKMFETFKPKMVHIILKNVSIKKKCLFFIMCVIMY